jgi:hypothetical protein
LESRTIVNPTERAAYVKKHGWFNVFMGERLMDVLDVGYNVDAALKGEQMLSQPIRDPNYIDNAFSGIGTIVEFGEMAGMTVAMSRVNVQKPKLRITKNTAPHLKNPIRKELATRFIKMQGKGLHHLDGINLDKVVKTKTLKKGTIVQQWVGKNGKGSYFTTLKNGNKKNLGIDYKDRTLEQFKLTKDTKVLQSTAADLGGKKGGGTQYFGVDIQKNTELIK